MKNLKIYFLISIIITLASLSIPSLARDGSSSSSGFLAEAHFNCNPTYLRDAGYNIYVDYYPQLPDLFIAHLGEISFFGERELPETYNLSKELFKEVVVLKNKSFDLYFTSTEIPTDPEIVYPAILKLYGELSTQGFEQIEMSCQKK